jgi:streptomycin 6-kinase
MPVSRDELAPSRDELARAWHLELDESFETPSSVITYGRRNGRPIVLKVVKRPNDEWHAGAVLAAFAGRGVARVLEHTAGAMLLERLDPGASLVDLVRSGRDDDAVSVLADVIAAMSPDPAPTTSPSVVDWAHGFARYRETGDTQVPRALVERAEAMYGELCASQGSTRLLHGDLQHYNVLCDRSRGWVAIDPKGVVGEVEYEIGAAMRNPCELPDLLTDRGTVDRRLDRFCSMLQLDARRVVGWCFSQAVLSAIWGVEDGDAVGADNAALRLAHVLAPIAD